MEIHYELTYKIPEELLKALNISDETPFETYCEDGELHIRPLYGVEAVFHGDDYEEGYEEGFDDGYTEALMQHGLLDENGEEINRFENADQECEDCDDCEYFCPHCGKCVFDESEENDDE